MANYERQLFAEDADILPPSDDRIFKVLLTHPDAKQVLMDIISTVIEQKVTEVQIRNNELPVSDTEEKEERFDVNCTIENGDQVDVEMHCEQGVEIGTKFTNFINKYTYYMTDLHSTQKSKGVKYRDLKRTYQITFSTHSVFTERHDYLSWFVLRTKDGHQLTDQINMIIIELDKLERALWKPVEELTSQEKWSLFLQFAQDPVHRSKINAIIKDKEEIGMAATILQEVSRDEHERARLRSRRMYQTDRISDLLTAKEKGEIEGEMRGEARANEKWQVVVAENQAKLIEKDAELADHKAEIARLQAKLGKYKN